MNPGTRYEIILGCKQCTTRASMNVAGFRFLHSTHTGFGMRIFDHEARIYVAPVTTTPVREVM